MPCVSCFRDQKVVARGLCNACYQRFRTRGTTEYAPRRVWPCCAVKGCARPHAARGFCFLHYQRVLNTGDPGKTKRPDDWGAKHKHPLYNRWAHAMRHRANHPVCDEWQDFLRFALDLGSPPDSKAKLFSANEVLPLGPSNFVWKSAVTQRVPGEDEDTFRARRARVYRGIHKERHQEYDLKRHYGLSGAEKDSLLEKQAHSCAICGEMESVTIKGRIVSLAVDHCHSTGRVRGLLCSQCNRSLGGFRDDPRLLKRAIAYLGDVAVSN